MRPNAPRDASRRPHAGHGAPPRGRHRGSRRTRPGPPPTRSSEPPRALHAQPLLASHPPWNEEAGACESGPGFVFMPVRRATARRRRPRRAGRRSPTASASSFSLLFHIAAFVHHSPPGAGPTARCPADPDGAVEHEARGERELCCCFVLTSFQPLRFPVPVTVAPLALLAQPGNRRAGAAARRPDGRRRCRRGSGQGYAAGVAVGVGATTVGVGVGSGGRRNLAPGITRELRDGDVPRLRRGRCCRGGCGRSGRRRGRAAPGVVAGGRCGAPGCRRPPSPMALRSRASWSRSADSSRPRSTRRAPQPKPCAARRGPPPPRRTSPAPMPTRECRCRSGFPAASPSPSGPRSR